MGVTSEFVDSLARGRIPVSEKPLKLGSFCRAEKKPSAFGCYFCHRALYLIAPQASRKEGILVR
jgi:hypothetical protein